MEQLDPVSKRWLVAALDPYHDDQLVLEGLPDTRSAPSVVQMHNQTYTLTAPAIAAGGNWDAAVLYTGFDSVEGHIPNMVWDGVGAANHINYDHASLSAGCPFGSLCIKAVAAGSSLEYSFPLTPGTINAALPSVLTNERCRCIGVAFEVHNTTAEVYKQGSLTVAQLPDAITDSSNVSYVDINAAPWKTATYQVDLAPTYATVVGSLMKVPTSQTWPAAKGVYAIPRMTQRPEWARQPDMARLPSLWGAGGHKYPAPAAAPYDGFPVLDTGTSVSGFSPIQAMFTGLSPQTTLQITFRTIVEYFPSVNSALLPMATPSPPYDAKVFRLYSQVARNAPYAVPVGMNSVGEYFRGILRTIGQVADTGSVVAGPYAPIVSLAGKGMMALSRIGEKKSTKVDKSGAGAHAIPSKR